MEQTKLVKDALKSASAYAAQLGHGYVGTEHLLHALLVQKDSYVAEVLKEAGLDREKYEEILERMDMHPQTPMEIEPEVAPALTDVIKEAEAYAQRMEVSVIGTQHLLLGLLSFPDNMACRFLSMMGIYPADFLNRLKQELGIREQPKNEMHMSPYGYPMDEEAQDPGPFLPRFSKELTLPETLEKADPVFGRENEIQRVIQILSRRTKNNPILLGEPGVGKTAIVEPNLFTVLDSVVVC
ncbi:MAG: ATP-dependent Clp protease ATP-binding subunit [Firmicutes bacterium]|nr:ATP-dependent Clp protease ATP-binding subunit [Bacillota bacterium]